MVNILLVTAIVLIIIVIVISYFSVYTKEPFDQYGNEFVGLGQQRYDLRGRPLNRININEYYVRPDSQIKLNGTNGFVWQANLSPIEQGDSNCAKVTCPSYESNYNNMEVYDKQDVCYKCNSCA